MVLIDFHNVFKYTKNISIGKIPCISVSIVGQKGNAKILVKNEVLSEGSILSNNIRKILKIQYFYWIFIKTVLRHPGKLRRRIPLRIFLNQNPGGPADLDTIFKRLIILSLSRFLNSDLCPYNWKYNQLNGICYSQISSYRTNFQIANEICTTLNYMGAQLAEFGKLDLGFIRNTYNSTIDAQNLWTKEETAKECMAYMLVSGYSFVANKT